MEKNSLHPFLQQNKTEEIYHQIKTIKIKFAIDISRTNPKIENTSNPF
jgi:hypothetical protein